MRRGTVHAPSSNFCFQTVHSDWRYGHTPNRANIFETGITLPGHSEVCLAVVTPCWLELCTVLGAQMVPEVPAYYLRTEITQRYGFLTWSSRKIWLALCTRFSTAIMPPREPATLYSVTKVSTMRASTISCRYSGWGIEFSTVSTAKANFSSPGVICNVKIINMNARKPVRYRNLPL